MSSPVILASESGNTSISKGVESISGTPRQCCDIVIQIDKDLPMSVRLLDVRLSMLGAHQIQNAATATCAALCLRSEGWRLSDNSIRAGLERTFLLGRSQILTPKEAKMLELPGAIILLDGAHTKDSALALANTIELVFPKRRVVLVVAMANDKDHIGFAREMLTVKHLDAVLFTEVSIAGDKSRTTSASSLKGIWIQVSKQMGKHVVECNAKDFMEENLHVHKSSDHQSLLLAEGSIPGCLKAGFQITNAATGGQSGVIVVTGSLHIVSAVLSALN